MKICNKCKEEKELEEFYNNKNNHDNKSKICKKCQSNHDNKHYLKFKEKHTFKRKLNYQKNHDFYIQYKQTCKCLKCGDNRFYVLDFHHLDPKQKDMNVEYASKKSINSFLNEVKKCIVLCSNCHREFHFLERIKNITIEKYLDVAELERH